MSREVFWVECAEWMKKLREMWLRDMGSDMGFPLRLLISFSGCFTFLTLFGLYSFASTAASPFVELEVILVFSALWAYFQYIWHFSCVGCHQRLDLFAGSWRHCYSQRL